VDGGGSEAGPGGVEAGVIRPGSGDWGGFGGPAKAGGAGGSAGEAKAA
jgi:hypothetical protein